MSTIQPSRAPLWRRVASWLMAITLVAGLGYCAMSFTENDEAKPAAEAVVGAVEAFDAKNGRYPESLEALVPAYLRELPKAGKYWGVEYAVEAGGKQCWVKYQVHRDRLEEYNCRKREWQNVEYEDSETFGREDLKRSYIYSEMQQRMREAK